MAKDYKDKKCAIYTRYSTDKQQSTEMQIQRCKVKAAELGAIIAGIYSDEATTGTNAERGSFQSLIFDAQQKKFDLIILYNIRRGSRDPFDWFEFRELMRTLNIDVVSCSETIGDLHNPSDFFMEYISVGMGKWEVLSSRAASIDGKTTKAKEALFMGGFAPLGYDIVDQRYVINERESKYVQLIFDMYARGFSYNNILDELHKVNAIGKRGRPLGKNSLHSILKNERYIGNYTWNKYIMREMNRWASYKPNPNFVEVKNAIPPIIDLETWEKVRVRMSDNKHKARYKAVEKYLLSGKIKCSMCGSTFVGHTSTNSRGVRTRYYVCGNRYQNRICKAKNLNADVLEAEILLGLKAWLQNENPAEYADRVIEGLHSLKKADRHDLITEKAELERKIGNAAIILLDCPELTAIREEMMRMQSRKSDIEGILAQPAIEFNREDIIKTISEDMINLDELNTEALFERYIKEIHALDGEISVIGGVYTNGSPGKI